MTNQSGTRVSTSAEPAPETVLSSLWQQFDALFPDDEASLNEIVARCLEFGVVICRRCNIQNVDRVEGQPRDVICRGCGSVFSATARTFFDHMRRYRAWLAAIWLIERGATPSSSCFHELLGIAQSSAKVILNRVMTVIHEKMPSEATQIPSAAFSPIFCRRSRETVAGEHPVSEEPALSGDTEDSETKRSEVNANELLSAHEVDDSESSESERLKLQESLSEPSEDQEKVLGILNKTPQNLSELIKISCLTSREITYALTMLEIDGFCTRLPGNNYVAAAGGLPFSTAQTSTAPSGTPGATSRCALTSTIFSIEESQLLAAAVDFIRSTYQGVSRKYLQLYLAAWWCATERCRWENRALLTACVVHRPVTSKMLCSFATERLVKLGSVARAS